MVPLANHMFLSQFCEHLSVLNGANGSLFTPYKRPSGLSAQLYLTKQGRGMFRLLRTTCPWVIWARAVLNFLADPAISKPKITELTRNGDSRVSNKQTSFSRERMALTNLGPVAPLVFPL